MTDSIKVHVMKYGDRRNFIMYYLDPDTEKRVTRSAKATTQRDAERAAAKWEAELHEGRYIPDDKLTWEAFRDRYELEVCPTMKPATIKQIGTAFNALERIVDPKRLRKIDANQLSKLQTKLRTEGLAEPSIRSYLAHIKSALAWAASQRLILAVPKVAKAPKRAKGSKMMKGRPLYGDEYDRMENMVEAGLLLAAEKRRALALRYPRRKDVSKPGRKRSDKVKGEDRQKLLAAVRAVVPAWRRLLVGLRLSGLRLGEALNLSWDDESKIMLDFSGRRPMMRILAELEKGGEDRLHPITKDFYEFLLETPKGERTGPVFAFPAGYAMTVEKASKTIGCIGKAAGVVVDKKTEKYASAHDLRRTFGAKWAKVVMPAVLQQLMRHESIETTMRFYVGRDAESTADAAWDAAKQFSNIPCNSHKKSEPATGSPSSQVVEPQRVR